MRRDENHRLLHGELLCTSAVYALVGAEIEGIDLSAIWAQDIRMSDALVLNFLLSVTFCCVVRFAKHLAVGDVSCASAAPRGYVVCLHFVLFVDTALVRIVPDGAKRAVGATPISEASVH